VDPVDGVRVAALANKKEPVDRTDVVFLDPFAIVIFFLNDTDTCWRHVKTGYLVLLNAVPDDSWVGHNRFAFKEDTTTETQEGSVNNEAMSYNPADVTASKVDAALVNVEDGLHAKIETDASTTGITHDTLGLTSGSRSVKNVEWGFGGNRDALGDFFRRVDEGVVVVIHSGVSVHLIQFTIHLHSLLDQARKVHGVLQLFAKGKGLFDNWFVLDDLAWFDTTAASNDQLRIAVVEPVCQFFGREATEYYGVSSSKSGAGKHGEGSFDNHRHVDYNNVANSNPELVL